VGGVRVDRVITRGEFALDGQSSTVENNVWLVGDDTQVLVIDAAHDPSVILAATGDRRISMIVCTHAHNDHINAAGELADLVRAPTALHEDDRMLWQAVYPRRPPDLRLTDGQPIRIAGGRALHVLHTPGHSPGGICLFGEIGGEPVLFSGDTLVRGGPGGTDRSFSDYPTILRSIRAKLLTLPSATIVHAGHGEDTTIGEEAVDYPDWTRRVQ
jgi:glyoxylase-like metal-dependent hydrolase (beta-lactamase superfamily II)